MKNYEFAITLPNLINPEKNHIFKYIVQFYNYIPINTIYSKDKIESLIKDEKTYHDMILNPLQYKTTKLKAWGKYINFVTKLIPKEKNDILRIYILLEYFTQLMYNEKEFYNEKDYISYWNFYADNCRDDYEIFEKLIKKNICTGNCQLYIGMSYIYERYHVFIKANDSFLKGFENCNNDEELNKCYKEFENRMLNRINREMSLTIIDSEEIDKFVHNEIYKSNNNEINRKRLFNEMKEENNEKGTKIIKMRFKIEKNQIIIFDEVSNNIRKGTQLVELYKLIVDYLNKNDSNFKAISDKFIRDLNIEHEKKPYSWLSNKRNIENQNLNNIMDNIIDQNKNINHNEKNFMNNNNSFIGNNNYNSNNQVEFKKLDIIEKKNVNNYPNPIYININNNKQNIKNNNNQINKSINDIVNILEKEISEKKTITNNNIDDEYIKKEFKDIDEHKKKIEFLKKKLNEEIELLKQKEENLKLIEEERNQRIINKKNILNIQEEKKNMINYNINPQNNNLLSKIPENNIQNKDYSIHLKEFLLNQNITKKDILLKKNEIGKLYNENKISLSKKNNFISLLENALNEISKKEETQIETNKPDFNNIKPLCYNGNQFRNNINFPNEFNKKSSYLPSPIQKNNNLSFVFSNSNNKNEKNNNFEINNITPLNGFENKINNKNNLTPNINQFFDYDEKKENQKKDNKNLSKKFENLFYDDDIDDINKEYNENNFSRLNDTFEIARRSNNNFTNNSSIIEKNNESRISSSIEKLFQS